MDFPKCIEAMGFVFFFGSSCEHLCVFKVILFFKLDFPYGIVPTWIFPNKYQGYELRFWDQTGGAWVGGRAGEGLGGWEGGGGVGWVGG